MTDRARKVLRFGTFETDSHRNHKLEAALRGAGVELDTIHRDLWGTSEDKTRRLGLLQLCGLGIKATAAYASMAWRALWRRGFDAIYVPYLGHADVLVARVLFPRTPIVWDAFISLHDTLVSDRGLFGPASLSGRLAWFLDWLGARAADRVVLDTPQHADFFRQEFGLPADRVAWVPVGADESLFVPGPAPAPHEGPLRVLLYAKLSPLHGVDVVLRAMAELGPAAGVHLDLVGTGQLSEQVEEMISSMELSDLVTRTDWLPGDELVRAIHHSDVCLGVFGTSAKVSRVIPNKVYQCLACARPVITAASPAVSSILEHGRDAWLVPPGNPSDLAAAIRRLRDSIELRRTIAGSGRERFEAVASQSVVSRAFLDVVET